MKESLLLFDEILNGPWFAATPFILFLNKVCLTTHAHARTNPPHLDLQKDILQEKIKRKDLTCCFPDYKGGNEYDAASAYIKNAFLALNLGKKQVRPSDGSDDVVRTLPLSTHALHARNTTLARMHTHAHTHGLTWPSPHTDLHALHMCDRQGKHAVRVPRRARDLPQGRARQCILDTHAHTHACARIGPRGVSPLYKSP